ncbi:glyoxylase-like metal-dependent hydrolase (beta-lactamase superfamily II) [Caldalkalibacillus uzonensis]|uniref:Glyoxylase-like metal-dependent hydrolase (Beta-lactamase superfamily II) n=1 Tax=Caldalkalibacillus uzonensis TaxID=353224 RepID=A0ABU0CR43_9BACI|nr:MBL fold metallo-hydrolase [Caldalkalibacillus uzonensis]MDQ0338888.1 glyoxylase-like metal-dependent hydrolase (beta-lactamase superfamily II) [Caldalkalibacillus uzonensis]
MEQLKLGDLTLTWLDGGEYHLDGGAMFGVVPKPLWSKKYPCNDNNQIQMRLDPILVQTGDLNLLIDSGIGNHKLTEKQKRNFGVTQESMVEASLAEQGLKPEDIDYVLMTHLHYDHACGLTKWEREKLVPAFPNAKHIVSQVEWDEMRKPNIRSQNTYWKINWESIHDLVYPFQKEHQVIDEITMLHTGGHSAGHAVILFESEGEKGIHFGDLMATYAHKNPLWVMAYDDYPMDSIFFKQKWVPKVMEEEWWLTFYHDKDYRALKLDKEGQILAAVKRNKE